MEDASVVPMVVKKKLVGQTLAEEASVEQQLVEL